MTARPQPLLLAYVALRVAYSRVRRSVFGLSGHPPGEPPFSPVSFHAHPRCYCSFLCHRPSDAIMLRLIWPGLAIRVLLILTAALSRDPRRNAKRATAGHRRGVFGSAPPTPRRCRFQGPVDDRRAGEYRCRDAEATTSRRRAAPPRILPPYPLRTFPTPPRLTPCGSPPTRRGRPPVHRASDQRPVRLPAPAGFSADPAVQEKPRGRAACSPALSERRAPRRELLSERR